MPRPSVVIACMYNSTHHILVIASNSREARHIVEDCGMKARDVLVTDNIKGMVSHSTMPVKRQNTAAVQPRPNLRSSIPLALSQEPERVRTFASSFLKTQNGVCSQCQAESGNAERTMDCLAQKNIETGDTRNATCALSKAPPNEQGSTSSFVHSRP